MAVGRKVRGATVDRKCQCCQLIFMARKADVDRGWAKFCSKKCKAVEQEGRTHQYRELLKSQGPQDGLSAAERDFDEDMFHATSSHGQDAHDSGFF